MTEAVTQETDEDKSARPRRLLTVVDDAWLQSADHIAVRVLGRVPRPPVPAEPVESVTLVCAEAAGILRTVPDIGAVIRRMRN